MGVVWGKFVVLWILVFIQKRLKLTKNHKKMSKMSQN